MYYSKETDEVFPHAYTFGDGMLHPGEAPGLGVDINEDLAAQYPYQRAYLPVNRKFDGTMHSW
jgi:mannonate dehydratase